MAAGKIRSTRKLRTWLVDQVNSGKFNGLVWDNPEKTMFRIPWKHAGKQDFRTDEDGAIFKAWAEFKGKLGESDPASWKTRLRCALNKSPEFKEVPERSQLDISEPYKVYQLVPLSEQGLADVKKENGEKAVKRSKRRGTEIGSSEDIPLKMIKEEDAAIQQISMEIESSIENNITLHFEEVTEPSVILKPDNLVNEIQLNVMIETDPHFGDNKVSPSFKVTVYYFGEEVLQRDVLGDDVRIAYVPPSPSPPSLNGCTFPRIPLPPPPAHFDSASSKAISTLLPFMEKGVVLTCSGRGIYAKRFCLGRVFSKGPQTAGSNKLDRNVEPSMIFSKEHFKQELEVFRAGGNPPQSDIILCFGEELDDGDDLSKKCIIIKIAFPWASKQIQEVQSLQNSLSILQSLAQQNPSKEITLNLVSIPV